MPTTDPKPVAENIVQLPGSRRLPAAPVIRVARPQPLPIVPFEAWVTVRDRVAAALLGGTRCLSITGAAGTGKTVMLEDVARVLRAAGRTVLVRQADTDPAPPARGETLFIDEADRLPQAKLQNFMNNSAGVVVLAGLGALAQRAGVKTMNMSLAPLEQEAAREYVAQWLASTGRVPAQLDSAALRQLVEASGGVPRLLSTLLGAGAWLAESSGALSITAAHIREAAELRSVLSPTAAPSDEDETRRTRGRSRVVWSAMLAGTMLVGSAGVIVPRLFPDETAGAVAAARGLTEQARQWLGRASGKPVARTVTLPPIGPHVVPRPDAAVVARAVPLAAVPAPTLIARAAPDVTLTALEVRDPEPLPVGTQILLLRRGHEMAALDDISAARLFYRRAAEGGSAEGAYALGRTYDPAVQTGMGLAQADKAEAMRWYRRAAAQGDVEAKAALSTR